MKPIRITGLLMGLLLAAGNARAAHITDKLLAGLYDEPRTREAPVRLLATGTPVEPLEIEGGFTLIRLSDGSEGWVQTEYVTDEKPAKVKLLELQADLGEVKKELAAAQSSLAETKAALERAKQDDGGDSAQLEQQLAEAERLVAERAKKVSEMQTQIDQARSPGSTARIAQLELELAEARTELIALRDEAKVPSRGPKDEEARRLSAENWALRMRMAQAAELLREAVAHPPSAVPRFVLAELTLWHYIIFGGALVGGFAAGFAVYDYRLRRRYGGFRI
jgi:SH3 domain protein